MAKAFALARLRHQLRARAGRGPRTGGRWDVRFDYPRATRASCSTEGPPSAARARRLRRRARGLSERRAPPRPRSSPGSPAPTSWASGRHDRLDAHPGGRTEPAPRLRPEVEGESRRPGLAVEGPHGAAEAAAITKTRPSTRRSTWPRSGALLRVVLVEDLHCLKEAPDVVAPPTAGGARRLRPRGPRRHLRPARSSAASAPPGTRRCTRRCGAACQRRTS